MAQIKCSENQPELHRFCRAWLCREVSCCPVPSVDVSVYLEPLWCQTSHARRKTCMYSSSPSKHRTLLQPNNSPRTKLLNLKKTEITLWALNIIKIYWTSCSESLHVWQKRYNSYSITPLQPFHFHVTTFGKFSSSHACATVTKQYNLVLTKGCDALQLGS